MRSRHVGENGYVAVIRSCEKPLMLTWYRDWRRRRAEQEWNGRVWSARPMPTPPTASSGREYFFDGGDSGDGGASVGGDSRSASDGGDCSAGAEAGADCGDGGGGDLSD